MILADEINRTPPKTQAALLEAMQERQVTVGRVRHKLADPFFVLATQNPIEQEGTYPLPEAQQDRFMFKVFVQVSELRRGVRGRPPDDRPCMTDTIEPVLTGGEILELQRIVREVPVSDHVIRYALALVRQTRVGEPGVPDFVSEQLSWGAGPRAVQFLILGGKARALLHGRTHVTCEDIQALAKPVLRHRLVLSFTAESEGVTPDDVDRPDPGDHPHPRRRTDPRCPIPKDFCILKRSSGSPGSICAPGTSSKDSCPACTAVRTSASRSSSCQHREYTCGDDLRYVDWKVWAKQDRYYVKQFEEDTNLRCTLLVDVSASMRYGRGPMNKYEYGCTVAASLAYLLLRQQDAVGCVAFDDATRMTVPLRTQAEPPRFDHPGPGRQHAARTRPTCTRSSATWPRPIRAAA